MVFVCCALPDCIGFVATLSLIDVLLVLFVKNMIVICAVSLRSEITLEGVVLKFDYPDMCRWKVPWMMACSTVGRVDYGFAEENACC